MMRNSHYVLLDTAVSSLSNVALAGTAAIMLPLTGVGEVTLASTTVLVGTGLSRGIVGEPSLYAGHVHDRQALLGTATYIGILLGGLVVTGSVLFLPRDHFALGVATALTMVGSVVQDAVRHVGFAGRDARLALRADAIWLSVTAALVALAIAFDSATSLSFVTAWGLGACASALSEVRYVTSPLRVIDWLRNTAGMRLDLTLDYAMRSAVPHGFNYLIASIAGTGVLGAYRIAQLVFGPTTILNAAFAAHEAPTAATRAVGRPLQRRLSMRAGLMAGIAVVAGLLSMAIPTRWLEWLIADWPEVRKLVPPLTLHMAAVSFAWAGIVGLRVMGHSRLNMKIRMIAAPLTLVAAAIGLWSRGILGGITSLAVATGSAVAIRQIIFRRLVAGAGS